MIRDASNGSADVISKITIQVPAKGAKPPSRRESAFTLVELLVVIGIISLLISVLLPALGKARQQANLIDCQSRLRQMGQALNIYVSENHGYLPYGQVADAPTGSGGGPDTPWLAGAPTPNGSAEISWYWDFTLSALIQTNILGPDNLVHNLSPIFHDVDTIDAQYGRYVNHYTCNPRIFPNNWQPETSQQTGIDGSTVDPQYVMPRKFSNIKPSSAFLFWDAPQIGGWDPGVGNVAYEQATELDGNELQFDSFLFINTPGTSNMVYNRCVTPGGIAQSFIQSTCKLWETKENVDFPTVANNSNDQLSHLRFRHLNNSTLNALCVDGHVESRQIGTFMVLDVCIQAPG